MGLFQYRMPKSPFLYYFVPIQNIVTKRSFTNVWRRFVASHFCNSVNIIPNFLAELLLCQLLWFAICNFYKKRRGIYIRFLLLLPLLVILMIWGAIIVVRVCVICLDNIWMMSRFESQGTKKATPPAQGSDFRRVERTSMSGQRCLWSCLRRCLGNRLFRN
eukprot:Gregarina_sp_Poly_1__5149@NODE_2727_length_1778_cov_78_201052_g1080_i1_p2_GENE_NODE_2727_length_1778_cov_78_201052_g1080_i1NODE_2727_length_1778_cov_78_201052_g1080_i1_p2_ORF_typecomplete_len161_score5_15SRTM1/PF15872_5/0_13TMEM18/PF14770_6/0_077_NODE_2727_length_1778_cov_78_201052_g1080_i18371319